MRKRKQGNEEIDEALMANPEDRGPAGEPDAPAGRHGSPPGDATRTSQTAAPAGGASSGRRVTPVDIQQKVFRSAFRGYAEREVDVFLDEVTEEMARLLAENRTIRDQLQRAEMRATTPLGFADDRNVASARDEAAQLLQAAHDEADRIVRQAGDDAERLRAGAGPVAASTASTASTGPTAPPRDFIHREREFLQRMAELIQSHAEAVREDVRRSRPATEGVAGEPVATPAEPPAPEAPPTAESSAPPSVADEEDAVLGSAEVGMAEVGATGSTDHSEQPEPPDALEPTRRTDEAEASLAAGAVDFAVDLESGTVAGRDRAEDELLPWEAEAGPPEEPATNVVDESPTTDETSIDADAETAAGQDPMGERAGARAVRPLGHAAPAGGPQYGGHAPTPAAPPAPWERRPAEERDEERRSLRELFWGED